MQVLEKARNRKRRHFRLRQGIVGTEERPRLNVFRSSGHIYAQLIDDAKGHTLVSASTMDSKLRKALKSSGSKEGATAVGKLLAERAKEKKITRVVFDRGGWAFHGRIRALAESCREAGLLF